MTGTGPPIVHWSRYRPHWYRKKPPFYCRATLVKRAIGDDGKPTMKQVGYISTYAEDKLEDAEQRREFWARARFRLGRLRLPPNQIALIEQQLAQRVPLPQQAAE
jgi:hypothetical protein